MDPVFEKKIQRMTFCRKKALSVFSHGLRKNQLNEMAANETLVGRTYHSCRVLGNGHPDRLAYLCPFGGKAIFCGVHAVKVTEAWQCLRRCRGRHADTEMLEMATGRLNEVNEYSS